VNDNTDAPTGIDLSFTMDLSDLRSLGSFEYSPETRTILERNNHLLLMAPMTAFFRRYPDEAAADLHPPDHGAQLWTSAPPRSLSAPARWWRRSGPGCC
jgi:hypothetical protein